jgi:hypothetical protein
MFLGPDIHAVLYSSKYWYVPQPKTYIPQFFLEEYLFVSYNDMRTDAEVHDELPHVAQSGFQATHPAQSGFQARHVLAKLEVNLGSASLACILLCCSFSRFSYLWVHKFYLWEI